LLKRAAILLGVLCSFVSPVQASALHGFTVIDVPAGDRLNVRAGPGTGHKVQAAYRNGALLSLTGRCTSLMLDDLAGMDAARKFRHIRAVWCEVWHDPRGDGQFVTGWAKGRFLYPH
jgi:hypothetical protein